MVIRKINKKAIFFSTDAIIALFLILLTVLVVYPAIRYKHRGSQLHGDILTVLSSLKVQEIDNPYVSQLIASGAIKDLNKSVLEQIGEFYITNLTIARNLSESVLSTISVDENVGLWYGETLLASRNSTSIEKAKDITVDRQIISGIGGQADSGASATGFSARAFLANSLKKKYFYFGGYVGDGNISVFVDYNGTLSGIEVEIVASRDFEVYINGNPSGSFENSSSPFTPARYDLSAYTSNFHSGENIMKFVGAGGNLYIAGGYVKITYADSVRYEPLTRYYFPGIEGLINFYDGIYSPETLDSMKISLHYNSSYTMFLNIGNVTVFNNSQGTEVTEVVDDAALRSKLDYSSLRQNTVPLRLGLQKLSGPGENADVVLITDFSGSMKKAINSWGQGNLGGINCNDPSFYLVPDMRRTALAQCLDIVFIDKLFNISGSRIWPVFIHSNEIKNYSSSNIADLKNYILNNYPNGNGETCLACAVNRAYEILAANRDTSRKQFIILMTDGVSTHCAQGSCLSDSSVFGTKSCDGLCDTSGACDIGNIPSQCTSCTANAGAIDNLYHSVDRTVRDLGVVFYTIGFGPAAEDCPLANESLEKVAEIGNGKYMNSKNSTELKEIYETIADEISRISYVEQSTVAEGALKKTILYPDSYIELNYTKSEIPYGLVTTTESKFSDDYSGNFSVPSGSQALEARAISYSGPRWTSNLWINNNLAYNLSTYGLDYTKLGDPYSINIPLQHISENNLVNITTGDSSANTTFGSASNKIIYTVVRDALTYSPIVFLSKGCYWHIQFEDDSFINAKVPPEYSGADNCYYNESGKYCEFGGTPGDCAKSDDAVKIAVYKLLNKLDLNLNNRVDVNFEAQDLKVDFTEVSQIPFAWSTEAQVRTW